MSCIYQSLTNENAIDGDLKIEGDLTVTGNIIGEIVGAAGDLETSGDDVNVSGSAPPTVGQVLKATSPTTATWQDEVENPDTVLASAVFPLTNRIIKTDGVAGRNIQSSGIVINNDDMYRVNTISIGGGVSGTASISKFDVSDGSTLNANLQSGTTPDKLLYSNGYAISTITSASNTFNERPVFQTRRSRGTLTSPTSVVDNDSLMSMACGGYDGNALQFGATIDCFVDGTPSAGNCPARIAFSTGSNSGNRAERLIVKSDGDVDIATGNLDVINGTIKLFVYTVGTLPTPSIGMKSFVSDSTQTLTAGIGTNVVGGGGNFNPVFYDGTNWIIG